VGPCLAALAGVVLASGALLGLSLPQTFGLAGIVAVALLMILAVYQSQVASPLERIADHARKVASGSSETLLLNRMDEVGVVSRSLNQMGLMFRWVVDDVASQVETVQHASGEIAAGNQDLSDRTEPRPQRPPRISLTVRATMRRPAWRSSTASATPWPGWRTRARPYGKSPA
jgi:aerotaxis receptor